MVLRGSSDRIAAHRRSLVLFANFKKLNHTGVLTHEIVLNHLISIDHPEKSERIIELIKLLKIYDAKIDEFYNATHIGGFTHRHFDGSHTPLQMWEKVKEALPDDTNFEDNQDRNFIRNEVLKKHK